MKGKPFCECCGLDNVRQVQVRPVNEPEATARRVWLCRRCLTAEGRAWRLRWVLVEREAVA
jgi:hypothetical protein